jgi:DNA-binding FadR family transcriptional regulator
MVQTLAQPSVPLDASEMSPNVRKKAHAVAVAIRSYIEEGIAAGRLKAADKLPTERELMEMFGGGRNTVRKTLSALEKEGVITRQIGSGTFISDGVSPSTVGKGSLDLSSLLKEISSSAGPLEVMELRRVFEPAVVELATTRASANEVRHIQHCLEMSLKPLPLHEFENWDDELHRAIAKASHNVLFERVYELISAVRNDTEWGVLKTRTLTAEERALHSREHSEIVAAVADRDAERARKAMSTHLDHVYRNMFGRV